jgi:hypothetical protein
MDCNFIYLLESALAHRRPLSLKFFKFGRLQFQVNVPTNLHCNRYRLGANASLALATRVKADAYDDTYSTCGLFRLSFFASLISRWAAELLLTRVFRARLGLPIGRPTAQPDMSHDFGVEGPEGPATHKTRQPPLPGCARRMRRGDDNDSHATTATMTMGCGRGQRQGCAQVQWQGRGRGPRHRHTVQACVQVELLTESRREKENAKINRKTVLS